jgi:hypothetical protein
MEQVRDELIAISTKTLSEVTIYHNAAISFLFKKLAALALFNSTLLQNMEHTLGMLMNEKPLILFAIYFGTLYMAYRLTLLNLSVIIKPPGKDIPKVQGGWPFLGQVFTMIKGSPWDTMQKWAEEYGGIYSFELFGELSISVSDPEILQGILQKQYNNFKKDLLWTYKPFMEILGNGLVTSDGMCVCVCVCVSFL